ncbi:MAG: hypothetical protein V1676_07415 [Candidatus Diapherotrites archaeon]
MVIRLNLSKGKRWNHGGYTRFLGNWQSDLCGPAISAIREAIEAGRVERSHFSLPNEHRVVRGYLLRNVKIDAEGLKNGNIFMEPIRHGAPHAYYIVRSGSEKGALIRRVDMSGASPMVSLCEKKFAELKKQKKK